MADATVARPFRQLDLDHHARLSPASIARIWPRGLERPRHSITKGEELGIVPIVRFGCYRGNGSVMAIRWHRQRSHHNKHKNAPHEFGKARSYRVDRAILSYRW
jgi:hypothetical protein